jgi:GrpB-like predicted nucleotidyltransferase (UPF0157 family)
MERIEHVGSTAVPGLAAKPILDIDIVVRDETALAAVIEELKGMGYAHEGDLGLPGRAAFRFESEEAARTRMWPPHHLYACIEGTPELVRHLAFRDYLRKNPRAVDEYSALKQRLAARYPWDRTRYSDAKGPFITEILRMAST